MNSLKIAIVIPAREKSTRFPRKPLADILGKPMIWHVWQKCITAANKEIVHIATDSEEIKEICEKFGANVVMTSESCLTGTDRVYEANLVIDADVIINVQGDEPLINPNDIKTILNEVNKTPKEIINAMTTIRSEEEFFSTSVPKVVFDMKSHLMYMSRAGIPSNKTHSFKKGYKQVCIYAFPKKQLEHFYNYAKKTYFENLEDIEILRFLELGYHVRMIEVSESSIAVDTEEDLQRVLKKLKEKDEV